MIQNQKGHDRLHSAVREYYQKTFFAHGPHPQGVDWNGAKSQQLRFQQLAQVLPRQGRFSLNDVGCGYGALLKYLFIGGDQQCLYRGYDLSEEMIDYAKRKYQKYARVTFKCIRDFSQMSVSDYSIASGLFHVKGNCSQARWTAYVLSGLGKINDRSRKGFSFNALTAYSDTPKMRPHLYYADPCVLFDYCKRHFSRHVALLHDYGLYEFSILVRKDR